MSATALIGGLTFRSPAALAFDINDPATYAIPNSLAVDPGGNFVVTWQKIQLGGGGYTLPTAPATGNPRYKAGYLYFTINGTSTPDIANQALIAYHDQNCTAFGCVDLTDTYAPASLVPNGNEAISGQIYDVSSSAAVSPTAISAGTPVYLNFGWFNQEGPSFAPSTGYYGTSGPFYVSAINTLVSLIYVMPFDGGAVGQFPNFQFILSNNSTSTEATGTLSIALGVSSSSLPIVLSTAYDLPALTDTMAVIPNTIPLFTQQQTSTFWYAMASVSSTLFSSDFPEISFTAQQGATTTSPIPGALGAFFNQSSTNEYGVSCGFTSSSFFSDPAANVQIGFCNVIVAAALPTLAQQGDLQKKFSDILTGVQKKPPFGYLGAITNDLTNLNGTSSATSTLLDASGTAIFAATFGSLDAGLAAIIGLLLGLWIFHRARHIEL